MARIYIDLPESFSFTTEIPLYYQHINAGGHLDNAMLLTIVSEARVRFFIANGYRQEDIEGLTILVGDLAIQYLTEAFHGETMRVEMRARDFSRHGCDLVFRVSDKASGREVARGKLGIVFYDRVTGKVAPIPEAFKEKVRN